MVQKRQRGKSTGRAKGETALDMESRHERILKDYMQGYRMYEIAERLGIHVDTVNNDLRAIRLKWQAQNLESYNTLMHQELERLARIEREAWEGWERSKQKQEDKTTFLSPVERGDEGGSAMAVSGAQVSLRGQNGDPRFLKIVQDCADQRAKLLGLYIKRVDVRAQVNVSNDVSEMSDDELKRHIIQGVIRPTATGTRPDGEGVPEEAERED